jgi:hypothetical protein
MQTSAGDARCVRDEIENDLVHDLNVRKSDRKCRPMSEC